MKLQILLLTLSLFLSSNANLWAQNIEFNDSKFKELLVTNEAINTNGDEEIQISEAEAFTGKLELTNAAISDLTGLEYFNAMEELVYYSTISTELNVSKNTALKRLTTGNLLNLVMGNNEALQYVWTDLNQYTSLIVENEYLDTLFCWHNASPMTIDLSKATGLKFLDLNDNLMPLIDVSNLQELATLNIDVNNISSVDLSNNTALTHFDCSLNPIFSLDITKNLNLEHLNCSGTQISALDVNQHVALRKLFIDYTLLTELDLSNNVNLIWFDSYNSNLHTLDMKNGNNANFEYFDARENLNLECIQVDNVEYSDANWTNVPFPSLFKENCEGTTDVIESNSHFIKYNAYPIPTEERVFIDFDKKHSYIGVKLFDANAQLIKSFDFTSKDKIELNIDQAPGLYYIKLNTDKSYSTFKLIKI